MTSQASNLNKSLALLALLSLAACGSSSGVAGSSGGGDPTGLYRGILENPAAGTSDSMWGLIDSRHQAVFVDQTAQAVYRYTAFNVSGNKFNAPYVSFTPSSSGGATVGTGTGHSIFVQAQSLTGYLGSSDATQPGYSFSDSYQGALYNLPASFATIAGSYTFGSSNTLVVNNDGSFTLSYSGCTAKGNFSIPDPRHNAYELAGTQTCGSTAVNITGLATFAPATSNTKAQLSFEYDDGKTVAVTNGAVR